MARRVHRTHHDALIQLQTLIMLRLMGRREARILIVRKIGNATNDGGTCTPMQFSRTG